MHLVNGRYATLDLSSGEVQEHELQDDYTRSSFGVMATIDAAVASAGGAGFALASGILTGSLVPASCAGFIRIPHSESNPTRMCPLTGFMGVELKLTGFDFVVITGKASGDGYVWIRDGIIEFVASPEIHKCDSWERTDKIRSDQGDRKIQVVAGGPWGDHGLAASQLTMNYWGGEDRVGAAAELGRMGLSAVAFRGMGELELLDPEEHLARSLALMRSQIALLGPNDGLASFSEAAGRDDFRGLLHRNISCYACPFPCRSYYKLYEDAKVMTFDNKEPGYLVYDVPSVERMASLRMDAREIVEALKRCARYGAEPMAVVSALPADETGVDMTELDAVLISNGPAEPWSGSSSGGFSESFDDSSDYETCLALGLCPRYWARAGFNRDSVCSVAEPALGMKLDMG
ncbi:MAG: hypothetical protein OEM29_05975 [Thermoplasmata archaeon]|nr:hypothetical protein [Thermoplasmata archaeon]